MFAGIPNPSGYPHAITVLENTGFVVGYCEHKKNPVWVSYRIHDVPSGSSPPRPSRFSTDTRTTSGVTHGCYTNSGFDRGHMAPNFAIATRYGVQAQTETFLMSNISPQSPALNRRVWERLERLIAREYTKEYGDVWVMIGPVFERPSVRIGSGVAVPVAFWKIIVRQDKNGSPEAIAFVIPQNVRGDESPEEFLVSIQHIQTLTGLDLFHELPDEFEVTFEAATAVGMW